MSKDFKSPEGGFAKGGGVDPKASGKPSAGITNDSRGNQSPRGAGPGTPANSTRIR